MSLDMKAFARKVTGSRRALELGATLVGLTVFPTAAGSASTDFELKGQGSLTASTFRNSVARILYDPEMAPNYHLTRNVQDGYTCGLQSKTIKPEKGMAWTEQDVVIQFGAPLGLCDPRYPSRNRDSREFTDQRTDFFEVKVNGQVVPYVKDPKKGGSLFWTFNRDEKTGHDLVAIRVPSPGAGGTDPINVQVSLKGVLVYPELTPGQGSVRQYSWAPSDTTRAAGLELNESMGYKVTDPEALISLLKVKGIVGDAPYRVSDLFLSIANNMIGRTKFREGAVGPTDPIEFFQSNAPITLNCHGASAPNALAFRTLGTPCLKPSGRTLWDGGKAGHAWTYPIDPQRGDGFSYDFLSFGLSNSGKLVAEKVVQAGQGPVVAFELDSGIVYPGGMPGYSSTDSGVVGDSKKPAVLGSSNCGRWYVTQGGVKVASIWPEAVPGSISIKRLDSSDPRFVRYIAGKEGPRFNHELAEEEQ